MCARGTRRLTARVPTIDTPPPGARFNPLGRHTRSKTLPVADDIWVRIDARRLPRLPLQLEGREHDHGDREHH